MNKIKASNSYRSFILAISVLVPVVVALLLFVPLNFEVGDSSWIKNLPKLNAILNSTTAIILLLAYFFIKRGKDKYHRNLMTLALAFGVVFLVSYVTYHASSTSTIFGDMDHDGLLDPSERDVLGYLRAVYLFTLLSHIALSIVVVPFVLFAFYYALTSQFEKHKRLVKFTFPIWLYVSITGVVVYLMISPYY